MSSYFKDMKSHMFELARQRLYEKVSEASHTKDTTAIWHLLRPFRQDSTNSISLVNFALALDYFSSLHFDENEPTSLLHEYELSDP